MNRSYDISMGYDGMDRLTSASGKWGSNTSFTYDTMGNITSKQLGSMTVGYTYNPTTKRLDAASVTGSKTKAYSFTYDSKGAVTSNGNISLPRNQTGQVTGTNDHSFIYDGNGKRVKDTKNGLHRYSIYDKAGRMVYQWDQKTETIADYIFLADKLVSEAQVSLGNGSQSEDNTNVGYTGHQWDYDSGLNYMQARYYDPLLGRFYSNDPIGYTGEVDTFNRYSYVANNPYKYTDPTGEIKEKGDKFVKLGKLVGKIISDPDKYLPPGKKGKTPQKYNNSGYQKHGSEAKESTKGVNSPKPKDGQTALDNSVPVKSTSTARVGVDTANKEVVVLKSNGKGTNEYHGFVPSKLSTAEANAVRKNFKNVKFKKNGTCTVKCD